MALAFIGLFVSRTALKNVPADLMEVIIIISIILVKVNAPLD